MTAQAIVKYFFLNLRLFPLPFSAVNSHRSAQPIPYILRIEQRAELLQRNLTAVRRQFEGLRVLGADARRLRDLAVARDDPVVHEPLPLVDLVDVEILVTLVPR